MLRKIKSFILCLFLGASLFGNNLKLGSVVKVSMSDLTEAEATLSVSLNWDNSWRDSYNNDAVWIFLKYRTIKNTQWKHVMLQASATVGAGYTVLPGKSTTGTVGMFVYRDGIGAGTSDTELKVKWSYSGTEITRQMIEQQEVFLMAQGVEMVYIPFGPYMIGDGTSENSLCGTDGQSLEVGSNLGKIYDQNGVHSNNLRSNFPTGYNGYYIMKYEVSQEQYMAFLNTLTFAQQKQLLGERVGTLRKGDYIFGSSSVPSKRNGIIISQASNGTEPIVFDNNYTNDDKYGEPEDGRTLACNYLCVNDLLGYSAWAGLRPMSEMEYEKACRRLSPMVAVPGEYAWGTTTLESASGVASGSGGRPNERPENGYVNAENSFGPIRCGGFAYTGDDRVSSGAGFSGVMELSGNVKELCAHIITGLGTLPGNKHGEGAFSTTLWQTTSLGDYGVRGGGFSSIRERLRVSDREEMGSGYITSFSYRDSTVGFRAVRMLDATDFLPINAGEVRISGNADAVRPVVCSGSPFTIESVRAASVPKLSGVTFRYEWTLNGSLLPDAKGATLSYPTGIFNTDVSDQAYTFVRKAICYLGTAETDEIIVTVPGRLEVFGKLFSLECNRCTPSAVAASLSGNGRFCWKNATDKTIVKDWSPAASTNSQYKPVHADFGYANAEKELWCVSDRDGCMDSVSVTVRVANSCTPSISSRNISMSTAANAESTVATLCGAGVVSWWYKDGSAEGKKLKEENTDVSTYKPAYADFNNEVGEKTVICRVTTGSGKGSCKSVDQEIKVNVSATLYPGVIICSQPQICNGDKLTIGEKTAAGVPEMNLTDITYEWYHNDTEKIPGQTGVVLSNYVIPNTTNTLVTHRFHRIAKSVSISQTSVASNVIEVKVSGVPALSALQAPAAVCADGNLILVAPVETLAGGTVASRIWKLDGVVLNSPYTVMSSHNGKSLTYTVTMACESTAPAVSNAVAVTVYARPSSAMISGGGAVCAGSTTKTLTVSFGDGTSPYNYTISGGLGSFTGKPSGTTHSVTPTATTDYTLSAVTDAKGCSFSGTPGTTKVTVNPRPSLAKLTVASSSICPGTGTTLTVAVTGGTANYSYSLSNIGNQNNKGTSVDYPTNNLSTPTTYTLSSIVDANGCTPENVTPSSVTVGIKTPVITDGSITVTANACESVTITGTAASVDCGTISSYTWYDGATNLNTGGVSLTHKFSEGAHTVKRVTAAANASSKELTVTFTVSCGASAGGVTYPTVKIGNQEWITKNMELAYGTYVAGQPTSTFGLLYDWSTATTICSQLGTGWHLPSNAEWTALANSLGGVSVAGGKLKEAGTSNWTSPNTGATNEKGWNGLPGGYYNGSYSNKGYYGYWWSAESYSYWYLYYGNANLGGPNANNSSNRFSVRCVKGI